MKLIYFWADWNNLSKTDKKLLEEYCDEQELELRCYNDNEEMLDNYNVNRIPALVMLNAYDIPRKIHYGKIDFNKLKDVLNKI